MSNKTLTLKVNASYVGPNDEAINMPQLSKTVPYMALSEGIIDVPASTASATVYTLPFGSIDTALTGAIIENRTGQDLLVTINTNTTSAHLASGGLFVLGEQQSATTLPVTAITLKTTALQSPTMAGEIGFRLFGDPV